MLALGIEKADDALVVVTAEVDEALDLVEVRIDRPRAEGVEGTEKALEFPDYRLELFVGLQRGLDALRHPLVGEEALALLLVGGKAAVDEVVEIALGNPDVRIGDRRASEFRQGPQRGSRSGRSRWAKPGSTRFCFGGSTGGFIAARRLCSLRSSALPMRLFRVARKGPSEPFFNSF